MIQVQPKTNLSVLRRKIHFRLGYLLIGMGLALALHTSFFLASGMTQEELTADSPQAWMEAFVETAPDGVVAEYQFIAEIEDYAISGYVWGEGGGYVVLAKQNDVWKTLCGGGGAIDGAHMFVDCGMRLVDAQSLWDAYKVAYEDATGEAIQD